MKMIEANDINNGLLMLLAVACLLLASRYASWLRRDWSSQGFGPRDGLVPEIDGTQLYYGRKKWPQYEARFNLRLSYVYGPVVLIRHQSTTLLAKLGRCMDSWFYRTRDSTDTTILVNSLSKNERVLKGLLGACASRRPSIAAGKYLSRGRRIVLQPYGPDWLRHRRAFTSLLTKDKISNRWTKALRHEAMVLVLRIGKLGNSHNLPEPTVLDEISRFTASSVMQITYARRVETPGDPILKDLQTCFQNIASAFTPGKYWVEDLPLLDMFPVFISPWKRKLTSDHLFEMALFEGLLRDVETRLDGNKNSTRSNCKRFPQQAGDVVITPGESAAAELLRNAEQFQLDRGDIAYLAAGIFEAGTETTAMTLSTFLLAAACYPEAITRAQTEIEAYMNSKECKDDSVPTFSDLQHLPYLSAVVKEALRLTPTGSSGVGHTPTKPVPHTLSLECDGVGDTVQLTVPPGTTVLANTYGLHHDQDRYPDPWRFDPDRWMTPDTDQKSPSGIHKCWPSGLSLDHTHANFAFGFGRRICPGSSLASHSLSMSIALSLLCFDFRLTDRAEVHRQTVEKQDREEYRRWTELFPDEDRAAMDRERSSKEGCEDEGDGIGRVLIDAYITFKLSKAQLAECVYLQPRKDKPWLRVVGDTLVSMRCQRIPES
ncbi:hypothetical protein N8I77_002288 [Diaporthe amygdali]|uniref:Cytochrome P450 n=1 Tax=Phomopsis amygdali TaxID=1214568 RepID=A0AAD9WB71_PHOAM|nr:hypothetical protein N8I77_002288 [Diaporthe amygdali]